MMKNSLILLLVSVVDVDDFGIPKADISVDGYNRAGGIKISFNLLNVPKKNMGFIYNFPVIRDE